MTAYILDDRGYFWWDTQTLADNEFAPATGCWGNLTISEDGQINLELDGSLDGDAGFPDFSTDRAITKSIHGLLKHRNENVILYDVWVNGGQLKSHSFSYVRYMATHALVSKESIHRPTYAPRFRKMAIELSGYEEWVGRGQLRVQRHSERVVVEHARNNNRVYRLRDCAVRLRQDIQGSRDTFGTREAHFKEVSALDTKFSGAMTVGQVVQEHKLIEDFLVVLTGSENAIGWPIVYTTKCRLGSALYFHRFKRPYVALNQGNCWVTLGDIEGLLGVILSAWLNKSRELGPGFYMYTGNHRGLDLYVENRFTNLIFGLESLHRRIHGSSINPGMRVKIERILVSAQSSMARKDSKWLAARLNSIEPSLEERLNEVIGTTWIDLNQDILKDFLKTCSQLRHNVAHRGEIDTEKNPSELHQLSKLIAALDVLYRARILHEIGVPDKVLRSVFSNKAIAYAIKRTLYQAGLLADDPQVVAHQTALANLPDHLRSPRKS